MKEEKKKKRRWPAILGGVIALLLVLYIVLVYFLVSAALVPSFMEKLDAFEEITDKGYSEQVHTDDIKENRKAALEKTKAWIEECPPEKLEIKSEDGFRLVAARFMQEEKSDKWVMLLHGYTGWKEEMYQYAMWYYEKGFNVIVPDQRCQGESQGDFIGMGWTDHYDCMLWLDMIIEENPDASIVIEGQSMGSATALMMTGEECLPANVKAVIADCPYTDAYSMFGDKVTEWFGLPAFPLVDSARLMLKLRGGYDLNDASALNAVAKSSTPTLFIHGTEDAMISYHMSEQLYEAERAEKELVLVDGAGHAQASDKDPDLFYEKIEEFINKYM